MWRKPLAPKEEHGNLQVAIFQAVPKSLAETKQILATKVFNQDPKPDIVVFPELFISHLYEDEEKALQQRIKDALKTADGIQHLKDELGADFWGKYKIKEEKARAELVQFCKENGVGLVISGNDFTADGSCNSAWVYDKDGNEVLKAEKQRIDHKEKDLKKELDERFDKRGGAQGEKIAQLKIKDKYFNISCVIGSDLEDKDIVGRLESADRQPSLIFNPSAVKAKQKGFGDPNHLHEHQNAKFAITINLQPATRFAAVIRADVPGGGEYLGASMAIAKGSASVDSASDWAKDWIKTVPVQVTYTLKHESKASVSASAASSGFHMGNLAAEVRKHMPVKAKKSKRKSKPEAPVIENKASEIPPVESKTKPVGRLKASQIQAIEARDKPPSEATSPKSGGMAAPRRLDTARVNAIENKLTHGAAASPTSASAASISDIPVAPPTDEVPAAPSIDQSPAQPTKSAVATPRRLDTARLKALETKLTQGEAASSTPVITAATSDISVAPPAASIDQSPTQPIEQKVKPIQEGKTELPKVQQVPEMTKQQVVDLVNGFSAILATFIQDVKKHHLPRDKKEQLSAFAASIESRLKVTAGHINKLQQQDTKLHIVEQLMSVTTVMRDFDTRIQNEIFPLEIKGDKRSVDVGSSGGHGDEEALFYVLTKARDAYVQMQLSKQQAAEIKDAVIKPKVDVVDVFAQKLNTLIARLEALNKDLKTYHGANTGIQKELDDKSSKWLSTLHEMQRDLTTQREVMAKKGAKDDPAALTKYNTKVAGFRRICDKTQKDFDDLLSKNKSRKVGGLFGKPLKDSDQGLYSIIKDAEASSERSVRAAYANALGSKK